MHVYVRTSWCACFRTRIEHIECDTKMSVGYGAESVPKIEIFYEGEIFRDIPR